MTQPITPAADLVASTALAAMDGVYARQQVLADNLANASTPGFHARKVDFESSLAAAAGAGDPSAMTVSTNDAGTPANADGNTVDVAGNMLDLQKAQLSFDSAVAAFNFRMSIMADGLAR